MAAKEAPFLRFMRGYDVNDCGCWIWNGHKCKSGYGLIKAFGSMVLVHRFAYELYNGPIECGKHILHQCDVKLCVNPDHMRTGTHAENMKEASERGLMRSGENHPLFGVSQKRPRQSNKVLVLGVEYESQNQAEKSLGLGKGTVKYWIKNSPNKAKIIEYGEMNVRDE